MNPTIDAGNRLPWAMKDLATAPPTTAASSTSWTLTCEFKSPRFGHRWVFMWVVEGDSRQCLSWMILMGAKCSPYCPSCFLRKMTESTSVQAIFSLNTREKVVPGSIFKT